MVLCQLAACLQCCEAANIGLTLFTCRLPEEHYLLMAVSAFRLHNSSGWNPLSLLPARKLLPSDGILCLLSE